ncbi:MAG: radical SAM protein [Pseudomonadota bacterium]
MESIYWVINHACHRRCRHCYDTRFRPYVRDALEARVRDSEAAFPRIVKNLPDELSFRGDDGKPHRGRIILAGGEVLIDPVRERVLYPILDALKEKYRGKANVVVQTTGDLVTGEILDDLLARGAWMVSVSGMDDFHVGHEGEKRIPLMMQLHELFASRGMAPTGADAHGLDGENAPTGWYNMFGATQDAWIGKLWPRGRAWENGLTVAGIEDNFCNAWSGGLNFLNHGEAGSEVSIEPDGSVYPCCMKTGAPLGRLTEEPLIDMLDALKNEPALQAINRGDPAAMGEAYGWDRADFLARSTKDMPTGKSCSNLCIGCDAFFADVMTPILERASAKRRRACA